MVHMEDNKTRVSLRLSPDTRTALKVMAAQQNTTASALVEKWIRSKQADTTPAA